MTKGMTCELTAYEPIALVRLTGHLDLVTAVDVRTVLHKAVAAQPSAILVDLAGMTIDDDTVLTLFSAFARTAAQWPGCPVLLCAPQADVTVGLDRLAVSRSVPVHADLASAMAAAEALSTPRRYQQRLPSSLDAPTRARHLVAAACTAWHLPQLVEDAEIVVTELVTNAMRHAGGGDVELIVILRDRFLHLSVSDDSSEPPRMRLPDPDTCEGGRGLLLVDSVASAWGCTPRSDGKFVWATLRVRR